MTIPSDITPFLLIVGGAVLIVVGFAWLQGEWDRHDRGGWRVFSDLLAGQENSPSRRWGSRSWLSEAF
jgi:hypothetical protein